MSRTRILIVEDEPIVSRDIQDTIVSFGYEVAATASSGEEAVKKAAEWTPDLVLMDIVLKGDMDGVEAAACIQAQHNVLVVYMSAHSEIEILDRAKLTCPYGYVMKPFTERELAMAIEVTLARRIEPPTCS
jgi:DNA-binding NarL/FixJ family response regulator